MKTAPFLALALALVACSNDASTASTGPGGASASSSASTGMGGTGGAGPDIVCVSSPVAAAFAGTDACPAAAPGSADALDAALAVDGLTRCDVKLAPEDVALSGWPANMLIDAHRLPAFTPLHLGPLRLPAYGRETADWLDAAAASSAPVSGTIAALSVRRGHSFTGVCFDLSAFAPSPGDPTPLASAILLLDEHHGAPGDEAAIRAAAAGIPLDLQQRLAPIVGAIDLAATEVVAALGAKNAADAKLFAHASSLYYPGGSGISTSSASMAKLDAVDLGRITEASVLLATVVERAELGLVPEATFPPLEIQTPLGAISVHGAGADTYEKGGPSDKAALLFDLGGDDTYRLPAGASNDKLPVSVAIDVRGKDTYGYEEVPVALDAGLLPSDGAGRYASAKPPTEDYGPITLSKTPRQGSGNAGIGLLFDLGAEGDVYRSLALSQGFGSMGVGVLYDEGGDDDYAAEAASQGAAVYGIGALVDRSGADRYASFALSQGFGGGEGAGALVDRAGDDTYVCDPGNPSAGGHPLYFSPQLPGLGNSSMSQGAAQGRRPTSATDTAFMAGGVGILRDGAGLDRYTASVFAQGAGYWQGLGMLLDGGDGADTYDGYWYVQGAAAHFALSLFEDAGGDDVYDAKLTAAATSIGVGHDFSASLHLDLGGRDEYHAPGLSLGSGNIDGIGCFVNVGGDDHYSAAGDPTLGAGNYSAEAPFGEPRQDAPTIGIFVDAGGSDTYTVSGADRPLDGSTWSYEPQPYPPPQMVTTEHGCGSDSGGLVTLP
ncbi:MAG: hypothetical protein U0414_41815 [Polyangiaceae bacterium]